MPLPVTVTSMIDGRLPGPVEAAAYYVVSEALTNVAKYAEASTVRVGVACADRSVQSRSSTTAWAVPSSTAAPDCEDSPTGSTLWAAASASRALRAGHASVGRDTARRRSGRQS